jgi:tRNA C32,U32 (ribose-2'-O)-methylase TrmJ
MQSLRRRGSRVRLPMLPDSRSLNLSNSAAVLLYEAWRQKLVLLIKGFNTQKLKASAFVLVPNSSADGIAR